MKILRTKKEGRIEVACTILGRGGRGGGHRDNCIKTEGRHCEQKANVYFYHKHNRQLVLLGNAGM